MQTAKDMNDSQRQAVNWTGGPLLVLAGPGSGKTFTITRRILYLLEHGTPPERILVITFTKEAAISMQQRFRASSKKFYPVNFGTFHSVFYQIVKSSDPFANMKILNNSEKKKIIFPILKSFLPKDGPESADSLGEDATAVLSAISYCKNTLNPDKAREKAPLRWRNHFDSIVELYEKAVIKCGRIDFDDMLARSLKLLSGDERFLKSWQERFSFILIDEFQDINPVQYSVVKLLAGKDSRIFAVGDDDQAIYGFRGSDPGCIKRFAQEYDAGRILLDINYRSRPEIVKASLAVVGENRNRFEKKLRCAPEKECEKEESGRVRLLSFEDAQEEYKYLTDRLMTFSEENSKVSGKECAVLFRTNSCMQRLAVRLNDRSVPFKMGENVKSIYDHFILKDIMAYLALARGTQNREALLRVINRPLRAVSREAVAGGADSLESLVRFYEGRDGYACERLRLMQRQISMLGKLSPAPAVSFIDKAIGYGKYLRQSAEGEERLGQWREILDWARADADRFTSAGDWEQAQRDYADSFDKGKAKETGRACVRLMTVHASKGLEFDTVIIADCNETVFPHGRLKTAEEIEEERRIFYVAMTRAKENLELLYLSEKGKSSRPPSRFLNPLL